MAKAIEQLLLLQTCDQEIRRFRKEQDDIPLRWQQIESRLSAHQEGLAQAERKVLETQTFIKRLEGEIEEGRKHILKLRDQQLQIKSNDGYKALEKEIAVTQSRIRKQEDDVLDAMEGVEAAEAERATRRDALTKEQARVAEELKALEERAGGLGGELECKEAERTALAAEIDAVWLSRYERIMAKRRDAAIALVEGETCGGCHLKLTRAQIVDARKADTLTLCNQCGRMLYLAL